MEEEEEQFLEMHFANLSVLIGTKTSLNTILLLILLLISLLILLSFKHIIIIIFHIITCKHIK